MIRPAALLACVAAATLALAAQPARAEVFCLSQDPADGKFRGEILTRDECIGDELEIGSIVDAEQGVLELNGQEIVIPPELRSDPQALWEDTAPPPVPEEEGDPPQE